MAETQDDGQSLWEHLNVIWKRTGKKPAALANAPSLPPGCEELWRVFLDLHSGRAAGAHGPARISWLDLDAYQRVNGFQLLWWELQAVRAADSSFIARESERAAREMRKARR